MKIFTVFELILIVLATLYLIHQYSAKDVPFYVKVITFISWFLSFAILIFVPLDVYITLHNTNTGQNTPVGNKIVLEESMDGLITVWRLVYWTSFIFTWLVLPFVQEYVTAGDFTTKDKVMRSIKINFALYGFMAACGLLFVLYLKASNRMGEEGIGHFFITFANCFGIALIIICLSYGLVFIPKRCFQQTRQRLNLKVHQYQLAVVDEQRQNLVFEIEELIKTIEGLLRRKDISEEDKAHLQKIVDLAPDSIVSDVRDVMRSSAAPNPGASAQFNKSLMVKLNKKMIKRINELRRLDNRWDRSVQQAFFLEDIIETRNPTEWRTKLSYSPSKFKDFEKIISVFEWIWYAYLARVVWFIIGVFFVGSSILVFFAEVLNFNSLHIFNIEGFITNGGGEVAKSQFLCLIPLFYISLCVYSALFNMKLAGIYGLHRHHQTDAGSLIFASLNFSRVSSPLVLNFLQMLKLQGTAFHFVMGNVNFAYSFTQYFPLLLVILIICNLFDVYGKILNRLGLSKFKFSEDTSMDRVEEGKKLLNKVRKSRNRSMSNSNQGSSFERPRKGSVDSVGSGNEGAATSAKGSNGSTPSKEQNSGQGYVLKKLGGKRRGSIEF